MPKTPKTDLQVLRALLGTQPGKLTGGEQSTFQEMYDKLASGHVATLSPKQRLWTHQVYDKLKLDDEQVIPPRPVKIRDQRLVGHDFLGPVTPIKPPGRA